MAIDRQAVVRLAIGTSLAALTAGWSIQAQAQDAVAEQDESAIVVTGSRIQTNGMQAPVPVTVASTEEIKSLSPGALITGISQMPQFSGNATLTGNSGSFFTRASYGALNLRGLGINRTLTLLNGRRVPSASAFGGTDINLFPEAMVKAVETTTGGASAAYGSDAVAGVVNFKLDTKFSGLRLAAESGVTSRGDNGSYQMSGAFGTAFGGGRGHLLLSGEYRKEKGIFNLYGRDWYKNYGTFGSGTQADPYRFLPNTNSAQASFDGIISAPGTVINGLQFNPAGGYAPFVPGSVSQGTLGTTGARTSGGSADDLNSDLNTLTPDAERYSAFAYADYDLTENLNLFGQFIYGRNNVFYNDRVGAMTGTTTGVTIFSGNAFLPASLQQLMTTNNIASFNLRRRGSSTDVGFGRFRDETTQYVGTAGFNLKLGGNWKVDGYYQYGRSQRRWAQYTLRVDRLAAAVDAVKDGNGNIVCRVSQTAAGAAAFPGCQPLNLFGRGNASAGAIDYVMGVDPGQQITTPIFYADDGYASGDSYSYTTGDSKLNITTIEQHYAELAAHGDLVDLWAGPVSVALGGSWRRDSIRQLVQDPSNPSSNHTLPLTARKDPSGIVLPNVVLANSAALNLRGVSGADAGNTVGSQFSKVSNIKGYSEVKEAFGEVLLPLIDSDAISLVANGAVRWAEYSQSGSIWAYKGGLELGAFNEQFRLRGTYSRDVRAGNLSERFDKTGGTATIDDPRTAAVEALAVTRFSGGNPLVKPEKADTYTIGAVFRPDFIPGLSLSLDYYSIRIKDAISQVGNQSVLDRCFKQNDQNFCELITTVNGPATPTDTGAITLVGDVFVNVARTDVRGLDFEGNYTAGIKLFGGDESLTLRTFASWLLERSDTDQNGFKTDLTGQLGARQNDATYFPYAKFRANAGLTYRNGSFSTLLQARYIGPGLQDACGEAGRCQTAADPKAVNPLRYIQDNKVSSILYLDFKLGYKMGLGGRDFEIYGNVTNLTDKAPPLTPSYSPFFGWSQQFNSTVYDILGRRFTVGVKLGF